VFLPGGQGSEHPARAVGNVYNTRILVFNTRILSLSHLLTHSLSHFTLSHSLSLVLLLGGEGSGRPARAAALPVVAARMPGDRRGGGTVQFS